MHDNESFNVTLVTCDDQSKAHSFLGIQTIYQEQILESHFGKEIKRVLSSKERIFTGFAK